MTLAAKWADFDKRALKDRSKAIRKEMEKIFFMGALTGLAAFQQAGSLTDQELAFKEMGKVEAEIREYFEKKK
jgi:hypothetical protein